MMKYFTLVLVTVLSLALGVSIPKGLFEGDIAGIDPSVEMERTAVVDEGLLWPDGIVYYEIDGRLNEVKDVILEAMQEYESKTCLKFRPKNEHTKDYIKLVADNGCWSLVGRVGGEQEVSLGWTGGCHDKLSVMHELGHVIGLWHEHSRSDRDDYLEIMWDNIKKGGNENFLKLKPWENNLLDEEFDYNSVMMYGEYAFAKDNKTMVIKPKQEGVVIGWIHDKPGLSDGDVRRINKLYQCFGNVRPPPPKVPDFICGFFVGMCKMEHDHGYQWKIQREELAGRIGGYVAVRARDVGRRRQVLGTPFLSSYGRKNGCLSFDFYMNGAGAVSLVVKMYTMRKSTLMWEGTLKNNWLKFRQDLDLDGVGAVKFTFEAKMRKENGEGIIALDNIHYALRSCDQLKTRN